MEEAYALVDEKDGRARYTDRAAYLGEGGCGRLGLRIDGVGHVTGLQV